MPILRSDICVTTGPLPALIRRCPVQTPEAVHLGPLRNGHHALVVERAGEFILI